MHARRSLRRSALSRHRSANHRSLQLESLEQRIAPDSALGQFAGFGSLNIDPSSYDSTSVLVRLKQDELAATEAPPVDWQGMELGKELVKGFGIYQVHLLDGQSVEQALVELQNDSRVLYAEPNYFVSVALSPNDTRYSQQWALNNTGQTGGKADADIDAPEGWDVRTSAATTIVAVIDTGVDYNHPDLRDNMWTNQAELNGSPGVDDDGNGYVDDIHGYDFFNNDGNPMDDHGHGTHVAGTIGATGNNGTGVTGVAWDVQIMAIKFLNDTGGGTLAGAVAAVDYSVRNGAHVSSNSWGGGGFSQALFDAIARGRDKGQVFVAAAGNDGRNNDVTPTYPSSYNLPNIIAVAATDHNDALAGFSNYGPNRVDIGAPGVSIVSTVPSGVPLGSSTGYRSLSGTSMATPHVSGVVALVREQHPEWNYQQIIEQVLTNADPVASLAGKTVTGARLNLAGALSGEPPPDTTGPWVSQAVPLGITTATSKVTVTFNEVMNPATFTPADIVAFNGPNGAISISNVQVVAGTDNKTFEITFAQQTTLGSYTMTFGPDIRDAAGNPMDQDQDGNSGEPVADQFTVSFSISDSFVFPSANVPVRFPTLNFAVSSITIDEDIIIGDLNVQLDITHPSSSNLVINLLTPTGQVITLSASNGSGANYTGTIFDDEAATSITNGSSPFTGSYRPEGFLSLVDGTNGRGLWRLWIENWSWAQTGTLNSWSLTIQPEGGGGTPTNQPPDAVNDSASTNEDTEVVIDVLFNDTDPDGDTLTVTGVSNVTNGQATVNADNTITFVPNSNYHGTASFQYSISDGRGGTDSATVTIQIAPVNDPPLAGDDAFSTNINTPLTLTSAQLLANDTDVDGDSLTISGVGSASKGTAVLNSNGTITYTPNSGFAGTDSFTYTVSDGKGGTDTAVITLQVAGEIVWVEDKLPAGATPLASGGDRWFWISSNPQPFSGSMAHQSNIAAGVHQHYFLGATEKLTISAGDKLFTYVFLDPNNMPQSVMIQFNDGSWEHRAYWGANLFSWGTDGTASRRRIGDLPPAGQWVRLEVDAEAVGLAGRTIAGMAFTLYGGRATWDRAGLVKASPSNNPPVANDDEATVVVNNAVQIPVLANDSDPDGDPLTIVTVGTPSNGKAQINASGTITYTPNANFVGDDSFTYTISDGRGGTDSATVTVTVTDLVETVWVEDRVPQGATLLSSGGDRWFWISSNPQPFSGNLAHQSNIAAGVHQHYFLGATETLTVETGDNLFAYIYIDPANVPESIMLQWNDGTWDHRAYWGANRFTWGVDGTASRLRMGDLPPVGQWVRLEVPASLVGLEGRILNGMAFTLYGGRATWDRAGKVSADGSAGDSAASNFASGSGSPSLEAGSSGGTAINRNGSGTRAARLLTLSGFSPTTFSAVPVQSARGSAAENQSSGFAPTVLDQVFSQRDRISLQPQANRPIRAAIGSRELEALFSDQESWDDPFGIT